MKEKHPDVLDLFDLLVPGGKWLTAIGIPIISQVLELHLPQSHTGSIAATAVAVISKRSAVGYLSLPIEFHQRLTVSTAKVEVS